MAWRRLAEICGEYLKKGRPVAVEGVLQIRSYQDKTGATRTMTEVVLDNMQMLGSKSPAQARDLSADKQNPESVIESDEIPF